MTSRIVHTRPILAPRQCRRFLTGLTASGLALLLGLSACETPIEQERRSLRRDLEELVAARQFDSVLSYPIPSYIRNDTGLMSLRMRAGDSARTARTRLTVAAWDSLTVLLDSAPPGGEKETELLRAIVQLPVVDSAVILLRDSLHRVLRHREIQRILSVDGLKVVGPNSAGGVDVALQWTNRSDKIVKYARFTFQAFNRVGDPVPDELGRGSTATGELVGPFLPGASCCEFVGWANLWYNSTIRRVRLLRASLEYMDGTVVDLDTEDLRLAASRRR